MSVSDVCIQLSSAHKSVLALCSTLASRRPYLIGDELLAVGVKIAVGVAGEPQVGRFGDEHAAIEDLQRARQDQLVEEDGLLVHLAVAVAIFEHADAAERLVLGRCGDVLHIADHLDDPEPALRIPVDEDWLLDHRFAGHELDVIPRRHGGTSSSRRRARGRAILAAPRGPRAASHVERALCGVPRGRVPQSRAAPALRAR